MAISTAPAVDPAMMDRRALGLGLGLVSSWVAIGLARGANWRCGELHRKRSAASMWLLKKAGSFRGD
jgi:hypothetical protein